MREIGNNTPPAGEPPAVILENPKYADNVGKILRLCAAYGIKQLWWTGDRVNLADYTGHKKRLPREERMKGYGKVQLLHYDRPFDHFRRDRCTIYCVEVKKGSESLPWVDYRAGNYRRPVWVFGPEDGSVSQVARRFCHRFVQIPVMHCLNLATAAATVLYDWQYKEIKDYGAAPLVLDEKRGVLPEERSCFAS